MRSRFILMVVAILLIAGFAALNWTEIIRPTPVAFGPIVMDAPLGAILLAMNFWRTTGSFLRHAYATNVVLMAAGFVLAGYQIAGYVFT